MAADSDDATFIIGGGETGALMRSADWQKLPLGTPRLWPQSLRTAIDICLSSRFPIALYWGSEYSMLYNDDLQPMVGANKHPWALGRPAREVLAEIWSIIGPLLDRVVETGTAIWSENLMLPLLRSRAQEESYFTFTYSPVRNEAGQVGGVLCAVLETTDKVIEERRLRLLNALANATTAKTKEEACVIVAKEITQAPNDVPFALLYLLDASSQVATLVGSSAFVVRIPCGSGHLPPDRIRQADWRRATGLAAAPYVQEATRWSVSPEPRPASLPAALPDTRERIIFADDNADMRDYVTRLLGARWQVETVADGSAALGGDSAKSACSGAARRDDAGPRRAAAGARAARGRGLAHAADHAAVGAQPETRPRRAVWPAAQTTTW